jgi:hypothetical protein
MQRHRHMHDRPGTGVSIAAARSRSTAAAAALLVVVGLAGCAAVPENTAPGTDASSEAAQVKAAKAAEQKKRAEALAKAKAEAAAREAAEDAEAERIAAEQRRQERRARRARERAVRTPGTAANVLTGLAVRGRAPMTDYDRDQFGQAWLDADRNGCDTRNDILNRDLRNIVTKAGTSDCVVLEGTLPDAYTGHNIRFVRAETYSVDIDHVVALGNAWVSGASRFDIRTRAALANDPLNLLASDASSNRSKGDGDAATWLPPNRGFRCAYVARQVTVKAKYRLSVTSAEKDAMTRVLGTCPGQPATPDTTAAPTRVDHDISGPSDARDESPRSEPGKSGPGKPGRGAVYYENCDAARAAGAAPVLRGDPGYGSHLDRDGDGRACE